MPSGTLSLPASSKYSKQQRHRAANNAEFDLRRFRASVAPVLGWLSPDHSCQVFTVAGEQFDGETSDLGVSSSQVLQNRTLRVYRYNVISHC